jgi:hypothetical protein
LVDEVVPKDKKEKSENPQRLLNDIAQFQKCVVCVLRRFWNLTSHRDLNDIKIKLNAIETQSQPLRIVFHGLNEKKVQECVTCLTATLNQFQVSASHVFGLLS